MDITHELSQHQNHGPADQTATPASPPILAETEAARRLLLLAELQTSLATIGVRCVLAGTRRVVLRSNQAPAEPSGPTNPQLHVFTGEGTRVVTTDGAAYYLTGSPPCPVSDPAAAAARISSLPLAIP